MSCETTLCSLIEGWLETPKNKREKEVQKKFWRNNNQNFPNLIKALNVQVQETQQTLSTRKMKEIIPQFILCDIGKSKMYNSSSTKVRKWEIKVYYFKALILYDMSQYHLKVACDNFKMYTLNPKAITKMVKIL